MAHRMFAAEFNGDLVLSHIDHRADSVRHSINSLFFNPIKIEEPAEIWKRAYRAGWRVVPVRVEKIHAYPVETHKRRNLLDVD